MTDRRAENLEYFDELLGRNQIYSLYAIARQQFWVYCILQYTFGAEAVCLFCRSIYILVFTTWTWFTPLSQMGLGAVLLFMFPFFSIQAARASETCQQISATRLSICDGTSRKQMNDWAKEIEDTYAAGQRYAFSSWSSRPKRAGQNKQTQISRPK